MSRFQSIVDMADGHILDEFGDPFRWEREDCSTADFVGVLDFEVTPFGSDSEYAKRDKTITAKTAALSGFKLGETVQQLDQNGVPTGPVYELQEEESNDGSFITIKVIS